MPIFPFHICRVLVSFKVFVHVLERICLALRLGLAASLLGVPSYVVEGAVNMMLRLIDPLSIDSTGCCREDSSLQNTVPLGLSERAKQSIALKLNRLMLL